MKLSFPFHKKHLSIIFFLFGFQMIIYSQQTKPDVLWKHNFSVGSHYPTLTQENEKQQYKPLVVYQIEYNLSKKLSNHFNLKIGTNFKQYWWQYQTHFEQILTVNEQELNDIGYTAEQLIGETKNVFEHTHYTLSHRIFAIDDGENFQDEDIIDVRINSKYVVNTIGLPIALETFLGKGENSFICKGTIRPHFLFYQVYQDYAKNSGYTISGAFLRINRRSVKALQIDDTTLLSDSQLRKFGIDCTFSCGLLNRKGKKDIALLVDMGRNLFSFSKQDTILTYAGISVELRL